MNFHIDSERKRWLLVCLAIVGFGAITLFLLTVLKSEPQLTPIEARTPVIDAEPLVWRSGHFEISASGRVVPVATVKLQAQVSGEVVELSDSFKSGAYFNAGDALLTINPVSLSARVAELNAQLASAKADLVLAEAQLARSKKLVELKAAAQEELDQRQAALGAAQARVAQFEAGLKSAQTDLSRSVIRAPFNGRVVSERVSIGDVLAPGVQFADIYSTDAFELSVALAESDAVLLEGLFNAETAHIAARVESEFGGSRFYWPAVVDRVEAGLDSASRTIDVIVRVDAPEARGLALQETDVEAPPLLPSMFAQAFIQTRNFGQYIKVSRDSVRSDNTIWFVQVDSQGFGEVQSASAKTLSNQQAAAFIQPAIESDGQLYVLGSDIGGVLPGNQVQIRNHEPSSSVPPEEPPAIEEPSAVQEPSATNEPLSPSRNQTPTRLTDQLGSADDNPDLPTEQQ